MTKITIEIDDVLPDCVQTAIDGTREYLEDWLRDSDFLKKSEYGQAPCLSNDLDYDGSIHEMVDSAVPHRTGEIEAAWFLHGRDLEDAYESAGVGDNPRETGGKAAIYFYIMQKVCDWYEDKAADICDGYRTDGFPNEDDD